MDEDDGEQEKSEGFLISSGTKSQVEPCRLALASAEAMGYRPLIVLQLKFKYPIQATWQKSILAGKKKTAYANLMSRLPYNGNINPNESTVLFYEMRPVHF